MDKEKNKIDVPHKNHRQRMYSRYLNSGIESFAPHEILEFLLYYPIARKDVNPIAHDLLAHFGSLSGVLDAHADDLTKVKGMTQRASIFLNMLPNVMRVYMGEKAASGRLLNHSKIVADYAQSLFLGRTREFFFLLCLDSKCRLIQAVQLNEGGVTSMNVIPRNVVEVALRYNSSQVIFSHNHPSGSLEPSQEDYIFTRRLAVAMATIDIPVLDHVIVNEKSAYSFANKGKMDDIKKEVKLRIAVKYDDYHA